MINHWFRLSKPIFFNFMFRVKEEFDREPITTPIVISNHVSWFDMYYLLLSNKISSFLSKEEVKDYWFLGTSAKGINSVFIKRKNSEDRDLATTQIAERIKDFEQKKMEHTLSLFSQKALLPMEKACYLLRLGLSTIYHLLLPIH